MKPGPIKIQNSLEESFGADLGLFPAQILQLFLAPKKKILDRKFGI